MHQRKICELQVDLVVYIIFITVFIFAEEMLSIIGYASVICANSLVQSENLESDLWWLNPMTAALERHFLSERVVDKEPYCPCDV